MRNDLNQRVTLQEPLRARGQRTAVFCADGAGPNHVEVPRKRSVVPAPDVAQDCGLKFRHDVQGDDLPARRLEGRPPTWCLLTGLPGTGKTHLAGEAEQGEGCT